MASSKSNSKSSDSQSKGDATGNRFVYQEFGSGSKPAATERAFKNYLPISKI
jgi:hypothetical protein